MNGENGNSCMIMNDGLRARLHSCALAGTIDYVPGARRMTISMMWGRTLRCDMLPGGIISAFGGRHYLVTSVVSNELRDGDMVLLVDVEEKRP